MFQVAMLQRSETDGWSALVAGLRREFASDDVDMLAAHFLDAEEADFRWDNRLDERGLGLCEEASEEAGTELDRVAILGWFAGQWYAGIACVDGDGRLWALPNCTAFDTQQAAQTRFAQLH